MATSSIFTDFSIKDKKTARAFVKALEESAKAKRPKSGIEHTIERFSSLDVDANAFHASDGVAYHQLLSIL